MPFKTKKQKLAASQRHNFDLSSKSSIAYKTLVPTDKSVKLKHNTVDYNDAILESEYGFVKRELVKIFTLATLIIGFQLALKLLPYPFLK